MRITNNAPYPVVAFCWDSNRGYGADVTIAPSCTEDIAGPYIGEMDGGSCYLSIEGEVVCQETPDDSNGFQVIKGNSLSLASGNRGVTVRHHSDEPEPHVIQWRNHHSY